MRNELSIHYNKSRKFKIKIYKIVECLRPELRLVTNKLENYKDYTLTSSCDYSLHSLKIFLGTIE